LAITSDHCEAGTGTALAGTFVKPSTLIEPLSTGPVNVFMVTMLPCGAGGTLFDDGGVAATAAADVDVEADVDVDVAVEVADKLERRDWAWSGEIVVVDKLATAPVVVGA